MSAIFAKVTASFMILSVVTASFAIKAAFMNAAAGIRPARIVRGEHAGCKFSKRYGEVGNLGGADCTVRDSAARNSYRPRSSYRCDRVRR